MKSNRYSTAVHEAGHIVVARVLGLKTRRAAIDINGDDTSGAAEVEDGSHLPLIEQIALCSAGADAQRMLDKPTHEIGPFSDMVKLHNLIDDFDEDEGERLRFAGYDKSNKLLELHREKVERLAGALTEHAELDQEAIEQILRGKSD